LYCYEDFDMADGEGTRISAVVSEAIDQEFIEKGRASGYYLEDSAGLADHEFV
jgi:hypothetical protein